MRIPVQTWDLSVDPVQYPDRPSEPDEQAWAESDRQLQKAIAEADRLLNREIVRILRETDHDGPGVSRAHGEDDSAHTPPIGTRRRNRHGDMVRHRDVSGTIRGRQGNDRGREEMTRETDELIDRLTNAADGEVSPEWQKLLMDAAEHIRDTAGAITQEQMDRKRRRALEADFSDDDPPEHGAPIHSRRGRRVDTDDRDQTGRTTRTRDRRGIPHPGHTPDPGNQERQ